MHSLVYHYGGLGDFLTLFPLLSQFRKSSGDTVTLLGKSEYGSLGVAAGYIDTVLDADNSRYRSLFMPILITQNNFPAAFFAPYDTLLLFCSHTAPIFQNAVAEFGGKLYRQDPVPDGFMPVIRQRLSLIHTSPSSDIPVYPDLSVAIASHGDNVEMPSGPTVAIHPGSGGSRKNWPFKHFLSLADRLKNAGFSLCWFTGPVEGITEIPRGDSHFRNLPLPDAAAMLSRCCAYVGNDCGFSHLAAASGCPTVVLFGPSDPQVWAPRGKQKITVIHHPASCGPCHPDSSRSTCAAVCLESITVEEVVESVLELFQPDCFNSD